MTDSATAASTVPATVGASYTRWRTAVSENGVATVFLSSSHANNGAPQEILLKGVAYSPAPIGITNKDGPGFGDYFWDTPRPGPNGFLDFERVWQRDLGAIRAQGFNAVRVYSLIANFIHDNGAIPTPAQIADQNQLRYREHEKFLDAAWNNGVDPVYVLAGIPMPDAIWIKGVFDNDANAAAKVYWYNNFTATLNQLKDHPAVIGFTLFNEQGGEGDFKGTCAHSTHYWSQIQKYSERAKAIAPDKLIGWAFFDSPVFANETIELRRAHAKSIDFYGINAFQAKTVANTLDPWRSAAQGDTARAVLLTEFGIPATGHRNHAADPASIYEDSDTVQRAADSMADMLPRVFQHPAVAGMFYFEWSDEWWKQDPSGAGATSITRQDGGTAAPEFPNGWYDEEGFGLNSIALGDRLATELYGDALWKKGANIQVDQLTPRTALMDAVVKAYRNAEHGRKAALGAGVTY